MIELPNKKKCYNLPEQVAQNLLNIQYLAEQYKNIDALPTVWQTYKEEFDRELETFGEWTTTFEGWDETLSTYLANMSSAAVGAIAGQNIAPANVAATGNITAPSIIETMAAGYNFSVGSKANLVLTPIYVGAVKNGNKLTIVTFIKIKRTDDVSGNWAIVGNYGIPYDIGIKLYPYELGAFNNVLDTKVVSAFDGLTSSKGLSVSVLKNNNTQLNLYVQNLDTLTADTDYIFRHEVTFLLSDNLAS